MSKQKTIEFYYDFQGQRGQFIQVVRIMASHLLKVQFQILMNPDIYQEYGDMVFLMKNAVYIDGKPSTIDQILELDVADYTMINETIAKQIEP